MSFEQSLFPNQEPPHEAFTRRWKMCQEGIRKRVNITHGEETQPSIIIRIVQMRYERCSAKHIADVLGLEEVIVSSIIERDQEILAEFVDRVRANDELKFSRIPKNVNEVFALIKEFGNFEEDLGEYDYSFDVLHLPTKRDVSNYSKKNFLKERLIEVSKRGEYDGLDPNAFFWLKDKPFAYEIAFLEKDRLYHLIRKAPDNTIDNTMSFLPEKCWQLFHEGFTAEEIDQIFENKRASGFYDYAKSIELKIDRRNNSIFKKQIKQTKSKVETKFDESLYVFKDSPDMGSEFYMNINNGKGKVKSIRSVVKKL